MKTKHNPVSDILSICGAIIFVAGISGIGCSIWMFLSNNGGFLYWLSIIIGLVCIPVTALGYAMMGAIERQEKAKIYGEQLSWATWHEFVRVFAFIFGVILIVGGLFGILISVLGYFSFPEAAFAIYFLGPPSILAVIGGFLLVRKALGERKAKQNEKANR